MEQVTVEVKGNLLLIVAMLLCVIMELIQQHEVDCCKEELPFILPFEVPVQQQQQQQHEATEPQSSGAGDTVTAEAEQMNSSDQTTGEAGDVTEPVTEEMNTADIILEPAAASSNIQEDVAEPMELDQQIAIPITITTITPTGN